MTPPRRTRSLLGTLVPALLGVALVVGLALGATGPTVPVTAAEAPPGPDACLTASVPPEPSSSSVAAAALEPTVPPPGSAWFGPGLDWSGDLPADYVDRLGAVPSLFSHRVSYPLDEGARGSLVDLAGQVASQGAVAVLDVEPQVDLASLTRDDADQLAAVLECLHGSLGTTWLVRFGPEMNGSWTRWGQQPTAYVEAFGVVSEALHAAGDGTAAVWSPVYGSGYPFGAAYGDVSPTRDREVDALDTDGSGDVDEGDDPYGPYWPGDDTVDWVGMTLYYFGTDQREEDNDLDPSGDVLPPDEQDVTGFATNTVPPATALEDRLADRFGYDETTAEERRSFYERFAEEFDKRFLMETAALYQPDAEGDDEVEIKEAWRDQVLASLDSHPLVAAVSWLEQSRSEPEAGDAVVDWRMTEDPGLADGLRTALESAPIVLGPVNPVVPLSDVAATDTGPDPVAEAYLPAPASPDDDTARVLGVGVALVVLLMLLAQLAGRVRPAWRASAPDDAPVEVALGLLVLVTVAVSVAAVGTGDLAGASTVVGVVLSPVVLAVLAGAATALRLREAAERLGGWAAAVLGWRRAVAAYVGLLGVALLVRLLLLVPWLDGAGLTSVADDGRVVDLYPEAARLLDYPPPEYAVEALLRLGIGPAVPTVAGLLVVLLLVAPVLALLLARGWWWAVLALSLASYAVGVLVAPSAVGPLFADAHPLLVWQLPFVLGLLAAYRPVRVPGALLLGVAVVWAGALAAVAVAVPDVLVDLLDPRRPGPVPVVTALVVAGSLVAGVRACWRPVDVALGPVLVPLGRAWLPALVLLPVWVLLAVSLPDVVPGSDTVLAVTAALLVAGLTWVTARVALRRRAAPAG